MIGISTDIIYEIILQIYEGPMNDTTREYLFKLVRKSCMIMSKIRY